MGVCIKGFPLPNNCGACPLRLAWCRERIYMVNRPDRCPLAPVPPHGRLIDADAALRDGWVISRTYSASPTEMIYEVKAIDCLPTIIEAEEGE